MVALIQLEDNQSEEAAQLQMAALNQLDEEVQFILKSLTITILALSHRSQQPNGSRSRWVLYYWGLGSEYILYI